jgi:8-oxo-dGTP diphosphatase
MKMRKATLCFLKDDTKILLAMKKRSFGEGKWNGVGGKVNPDESIERAVVREAEEEIKVVIKEEHLEKVGSIKFYFQKKPDWDQEVHIYFTSKWENEPEETEEMRPQWYSHAEIPFEKMWSDDIHWLPLVLAGKKVEGEFYFSDNEGNFEKFDIREI